MLGRKDIKKINKALGFELYDWQVAYIRGDSDYMPTGRANGKTLAFVLRQLLNFEIRIPAPKNSDELYKMIVCDRDEPKTYTNDWFLRFVFELAVRLDNEGIETVFIFDN